MQSLFRIATRKMMRLYPNTTDTILEAREYVASLQERSKWIKEVSNLKLGDLVYINDDIVLPLQWPLGRVKQLYVGRDSIVRVIKIKTGGREYNRAVHKLRKLPLPSN